jgi:hypothetical protein
VVFRLVAALAQRALLGACGQVAVSSLCVAALAAEATQPVAPSLAPSAAEAPTATANDAQLSHARAIVATAESLFVAGHPAAALVEYTRAYEVLRGHPRQYWVLHNLAACNERMFRYDVALRLYDEYLRRAPPTEEDRAEVQAVMRTLRSLLGTLVVHSDVAAEVWVDDRRLGTAPGKWLIPKGPHVVELRAAQYEAQQREVQLGPTQVVALRFALRRLSTYRGPPRAYFWGAAAVSSVAAVAGVTFGLMALDASADGRERASLRLDTSEDAERTRQLALAADVCFGTALLFGATAGVLFFVTEWSDAPRPASGGHAPNPRTARLGIGSRGTGVNVQLEF